MPAKPINLAQFFLESRDDLVGFFQRKLDCPDIARDLTQETFMRLLCCEQRAPTENHRALAFFIAGNLVVDHIRKEAVRARHAPGQQVTDELLESIASNDPDSERQMMVDQEVEAVQNALNELPEVNRSAFYLSAIEGLTYAQIGECMGVSERIIAKRIAQTLKHCRARRDAQ